MVGTHFTRCSLDLRRDLQALPGGTALYYLPWGSGQPRSVISLCCGFKKVDQIATQTVLCSLYRLAISCLTGRAFCISSLTRHLWLSQNHQIFPGSGSNLHHCAPRCPLQILSPAPSIPFLTLPPVKDSSRGQVTLVSPS